VQPAAGAIRAGAPGETASEGLSGEAEHVLNFLRALDHADHDALAPGGLGKRRLGLAVETQGEGAAHLACIPAF
jgi:hypothetical protein